MCMYIHIYKYKGKYEHKRVKCQYRPISNLRLAEEMSFVLKDPSALEH